MGQTPRLCNLPSKYTGLSIIQLFLYIDSDEEVVSLFEVELQKPRNLSVHESEECEYGEGVGNSTFVLSVENDNDFRSRCE